MNMKKEEANTLLEITPNGSWHLASVSKAELAKHTFLKGLQRRYLLEVACWIKLNPGANHAVEMLMQAHRNKMAHQITLMLGYQDDNGFTEVPVDSFQLGDQCSVLLSGTVPIIGYGVICNMSLYVNNPALRGRVALEHFEVKVLN